MKTQRSLTVNLATISQEKTRQLRYSGAFRTSDLLNPIQVRYQTALRPVWTTNGRYCSL